MSSVADAALLECVALPGRGGAHDVVLEAGRVAAVRSRPGHAPEHVAVPAFREPHVHADRAYAGLPRRPESLEDAIAMADELRMGSSAEAVAARARRLFERASHHGAVALRTHVDHHPLTHERDRRAVRAAAAEFRGRLDVEIVAFATKEADPVARESRALLAAALEDGADLLGAFLAPHPDPEASIDALLDLAAETGAAVDVHLDEHCDPGASLLSHLAEATIARGLEGRVTAGHCCALGALEPGRAGEIVKRVAAAGLTVVSLPALNLYLQGRRTGTTPRTRGLTLVVELLAAGVPVRFGSDNVQDPFFPYGDADPLEAAFLAAVAAHVDDELALLEGICGGRSTLAPGDPAELVVIPAASVGDALARRPGGRRIVRG